MRNKREYGQSLVLVALLMIGMLAFLGLVLDGGYAFVNRRWGQDAADAAAFAGARSLAMKQSDSVISNTIATFALANRTANATDITAYYIDQNGNNLNPIPNGSVPSLATGVRVTTTLRFQPYFISLVIGNNPVPIQAAAAAQSGTPTAAGNTVPVVVPFSSTVGINYGDAIDIWGDKIASGSFQWVSFNCLSKPADVVDYLDPSSTKTPPVVVADPTDQSKNPSMPPTASWLCTSPGAENNSAVTDALDAWLLKPESERHWLTPVFDYNDGTGSGGKFHVVRFAEVVLLGYDMGGGKQGSAIDLVPPFKKCSNPSNKKCIEGKFIQFTTANNIKLTPGPCNTNGMAICGIGLSQ